MGNFLDKIFDSVPYTMAAVMVFGTVFAAAVLFLLEKVGRLNAGNRWPADLKELDGRLRARNGEGSSTTRRRLPPSVTGLGIFLMFMGIAGLIAVFNGMPLNPKACGALAAAGYLIIYGYDFLVNGAINRLNYFKVGIRFFSLIPLALSVLVLASALAGVYGDRSPAFGLAALAAGYLGWLGYFYGARFHQNLDAVEIGRALGFEPADSGLLTADWIYDAKGEMNGVFALFNIEVTSIARGKYNPPDYTHQLEVLCYCDNPYGIKLRIKGGSTGLWPALRSWFRLMNIPRIQPPAAWKGYGEFRCNMPAETARSLEKCSPATAAFSADFKELWLAGGELALVFSRRNVPWDEASVRRVLNAATLTAAAFNKN